MSDKQSAEAALRMCRLGDIMTVFIASYLEYISRPGEYRVTPAKEGKPKIKDGKIKKMIKPAMVGYKEFVSGVF